MVKKVIIPACQKISNFQIQDILYEEILAYLARVNDRLVDIYIRGNFIEIFVNLQNSPIFPPG
jgi:hypothetical protein